MALSLFAIIVGLLLLYFWRRNGKKHLDFPGPPGWPIVGSYFSMRGKQMHGVLYDWSLQYGGAFTFSIFGQHYLVISHPDTLQEALVTRGNAFAGRPDRYRIRAVTDNGQNLVSQTNLALNKALRRPTQHTVNAFSGGRGRMDKILDLAVDCLLDNFAKKSGQEFDPKDDIYAATTLTVCLMISGKQVDNPDQLIEAVKELNHLGNDSSPDGYLLDMMPLLRYIPRFPPYVTLMKYRDRQDEIYNSAVKPLLEQCRHSKKHNIGKALLEVQGQKYGHGDEEGVINMVNTKQTLIDLLNAGTMTTSTTFSCLLNILQCHTEVQDSIYKEIEHAVGSARRVTLDDKDSLPYTRAVVYELLRYTSIVALSIPHTTREDTEMAGRHVPKNTFVVPNLWACHHNPLFWEDPWLFKPERFLDEDGSLLPADHINRRQLYPFGAGRRVCLGEILATNRLFLFTANLVQKFYFPPLEGGTCDARSYNFGIVLEPPAFKLKVVARKN